MAKNRLDILLVELGLVRSRRLAQDLIVEGHVSVQQKGDWVVADKSSQIFDLTLEEIRVAQSNLLKYVSRGGLKLEHALNEVKLNVRGFRVLDVGISKGGFTDCLLQHGAAHVVGVDVGHDQLDTKIWQHPNVIAIEGVHINEWQPEPTLVEKPFDLIVVDLSFISFTKILAKLVTFMGPQTALLALIKPQFEVGAKHLNKQGIADSEQFPVVEENIKTLSRQSGLNVLRYFPSAVRGQDGNQEFFVFAKRK